MRRRPRNWKRTLGEYDKKQELAIPPRPGVRSQSKRRKRIAVFDFDGVIARYDCWDGFDVFGEPNREAIGLIRKMRGDGWHVIVNTTRLYTPAMIRWAQENGLEFDEFNQCKFNPPGTSGKPCADVYIDDRAVNYHGQSQKELYSQVKRLVFRHEKARKSGERRKKMLEKIRLERMKDVLRPYYGNLESNAEVAGTVEMVTSPLTRRDRKLMDGRRGWRRVAAAISHGIGKGDIYYRIKWNRDVRKELGENEKIRTKKPHRKTGRMAKAG